VLALECGELLGGEQPADPWELLEQVLGLDDRVACAESGDLGFDEATVEGIGGGDLIQRDLEVALDAVAGLGGLRLGNRPGEQIVVGPRGAPDCLCRVAGRPIGRKSLSHLVGSTSWASSHSSSSEAVAPTTLAPGAADMKVALALPRVMVRPHALEYLPSVSGFASSVSSRLIELTACGFRVGAALTIDPPRRWYRVSRYASSWALVSFLPDWRGIMTVMVRPACSSIERRMARATSTWYGRSGRPRTARLNASTSERARTRPARATRSFTSKL
jgi:hypothetical protein